MKRDRIDFENMKLFLLLLLFSTPLLAEKINPDSKSYVTIQKERRVETYDFSGDFPELEEINIDAKRKMRVEMVLNGNYPSLKDFLYVGSFGTFEGVVTGHFSKIKEMTFACGSSSVCLDFNGTWDKDCVINVHNNYGDVTLKLPQNVALTVSTKVGPTGKIVSNDKSLLKKKSLNWMHKSFCNLDGHPYLFPNEKKPPNSELVHLHFNIEVKEGVITLN